MWADFIRVDGRAERGMAGTMIHAYLLSSTRQLMLGAHRGYDAASFCATCVTPHIVQGSGRSAIDSRTTRYAGHALSQKHGKRIEKSFVWAKTVGGLT